MVASTTSRPSAALNQVQRLEHLQPPALSWAPGPKDICSYSGCHGTGTIQDYLHVGLNNYKPFSAFQQFYVDRGQVQINWGNSLRWNQIANVGQYEITIQESPVLP
jgi:hypothetical protein